MAIIQESKLRKLNNNKSDHELEGGANGGSFAGGTCGEEKVSGKNHQGNDIFSQRSSGRAPKVHEKGGQGGILPDHGERRY